MDMEFVGGKDIEKALMELKTVTAKSVARRVMRAAGQPIADKANANAPREQGDLNESYGVSSRLNKSQRRKAKKAGKDDVEVYIGTNDPAGVQQEFGNENHPAQPHLRPAWDAGQLEVFHSIQSDLAKEVEKTVTRARKRAR